MTQYTAVGGATKREAIAAIYLALHAPSWASPNLDGLADVLRDLAWLPEGPVRLRWLPGRELSPGDRRRIGAVLADAQVEATGSNRPFSVAM